MRRQKKMRKIKRRNKSRNMEARKENKATQEYEEAHLAGHVM